MSREFRTVGVVGLGTMGAGIAEVFARNGFDVIGVEQTSEFLDRGLEHIQSSTDRACRRGKLTNPEQQAILGRLTMTTSMDDLSGCDLVIEAVVERPEVKGTLFARLDQIVGSEAVLATNTSSLSVTAIAAATEHPDRVVGMHFFNPAPVQRLVEVIRTVVTQPSAIEAVRDLALRLGKNPVVVSDRAGFIANSLLFGYLNQAASMYDSRRATREDIDTAMRIGCGYPMGPLALLDLIGLDTALEILQTMYRESRSRRHAPSPIIRQLVTAGLLGRKTGRGFFTYKGPHSGEVVDDAVGVAPSARPISVIAVIGAGDAANAAAELVAAAGYDVMIAAEVEDGRELATADVVIDTVDMSSDQGGRPRLFASLGRVCRPGAILATTSDVALTELAASSKRPVDVVGMHPIGLMQRGNLVEIVSTVLTGEDVAATVRSLAVNLGLTPVSCTDRTGFIADALLFPYLNDAVRMVEVEYATADDIDTAMRDGCALPSGPFELLDTIGIDVALGIQRKLFDASHEPELAPSVLLDQLVAVGHLGRESGRGFRDHDGS